MTEDSKRVWLHSMAASVVAVVLSLFGYQMAHSGLSESAFLLVPSCTGLVIAFMSKGRKVVAITALTSLLLSLSILVIAGLEGIACVLMAFPILLIGIGSGALVGYLVGKKFIHRYGNVVVVAFCVCVLSLVGFSHPQMAEPRQLVVETSMDFHAPMSEVWRVVREPGVLEGEGDRFLRALGLPVPVSCSLTEGGERVCYFEGGEMQQVVTRDEFGKAFEVAIVDSLEVRDWISFVDAGYAFEQHEGFVRVTRTDRIASRLRPRWYWGWFESRCVRLEHGYVMGSMRAEVEGR